MIHSTKDAGKELRYALYKEAMKALEPFYGKSCWEKGWPLIRGLGTFILKNEGASDSECADAVILYKW